MTNVEDGIKEGSSDHIEHSGETAMPKEPQRITVSASHQAFIRKKFDCRVLPIVCILYTLSYLDRGNIGNAKTAGLEEDLGLNDSQWAWVLNAFYICYVLCEWTVLFWKLMPAHIYVASLCVFWGAAAMCSGAVNNMAQLIVCRCFLGIFEASFGAGAPYFLSLFYQRHELGFRVSMLLGMSPVANCFSSALAYGITQIKGSIQPWRLLFIIEGAPTVAFAIVVFFFLADSPGTAKFLNESEKTEAVERLQTVDRTARSSVQWHQVFQGMGDYKNYVHTLIHFCCNYSFAGLSNFLPTIIASMGYDSVSAQGLSAPTYFVSFLFCIAAALLTDRCGRRGLAIAGFALLGMAGYLVLAVVENMQARYAGVWLAVCGVFPALCLNITWLLNNQGGDSKRGVGMALLAVFGQCSSFASSSLFPKSDSPFYVKGSAVGCGLSGCIAILAFGLYLALDRENKRRDRVWGEVSDDTHVDVTQGGDRNPQFRYLI